MGLTPAKRKKIEKWRRTVVNYHKSMRTGKGKKEFFKGSSSTPLRGKSGIHFSPSPHEQKSSERKIKYNREKKKRRRDALTVHSATKRQCTLHSYLTSSSSSPSSSSSSSSFYSILHFQFVLFNLN